MTLGNCYSFQRTQLRRRTEKLICFVKLTESIYDNLLQLIEVKWTNFCELVIAEVQILKLWDF